MQKIRIRSAREKEQNRIRAREYYRINREKVLKANTLRYRLGLTWSQRPENKENLKEKKRLWAARYNANRSKALGLYTRPKCEHGGWISTCSRSVCIEGYKLRKREARKLYRKRPYVRAKDLAYQQRWAKNNPEKTRAICKRGWEKNKHRWMKSNSRRTREWLKKNPEKMSGYNYKSRYGENYKLFMELRKLATLLGHKNVITK